MPGLPPCRGDSLCESLPRDGVTQFRRPGAAHASRNASAASFGAANQSLTGYYAGKKDSGTDKNGTIHAFAGAAIEGGGLLAGGLHVVLRLLFSRRTFPLSDPSAGLGSQISRHRRNRQRQKMEARIGFCPAAFPDDRRSETAGVRVLALTFLALSTIVQGWGSWFWDWTKGELLDIAFGIVVVLILFAVMRRSPRHWLSLIHI